uniref:Plexin_cytopl domain-containing protein n=1 Tax=Macrostomum lignano TaxID=282301 RepID=A0A1I8IEX8_9PLAT
AKRREEKNSHIETQINLLEAQVSQNCRDAFAELQLNSNGLGDRKGGLDEWLAPCQCAALLNLLPIPALGDRYKDRHRTQDPLFTDVVTPESAAAALAAEPLEIRKALGQLHSLLLNEDFLLIMISAMESRSDTFMYQERNHFGSLLSALLYSDIGYFTRILSRLIESLVSRRQEANDNYKVVFRRCDSVAERLLPNWLAFLMYEHLSSRVAGPLHRLYWSMHQQISKGPVDQVTGDSKYTINEQKLLKKEIPFKALTLTFQDRLRAQQQQIQCSVTVLDCDTVNQAKEKILDAVYTQLGLPNSQRVPASQFDLEENSNERYLILTELDNSNDDDAVEGLQRLRRLDSFNLDSGDQSGAGDCSGEASIVVFLKPRKEPPRMNGSAAAAAAAAVAASRRLGG